MQRKERDVDFPYQWAIQLEAERDRRDVKFGTDELDKTLSFVGGIIKKHGRSEDHGVDDFALQGLKHRTQLRALLDLNVVRTQIIRRGTIRDGGHSLPGQILRSANRSLNLPDR